MAEETMFEQVTDNQLEQNEAPLTLTVTDEYKSFVEQYVGEGKKYSNVGELAKAYANADRHIVELNSDLAKNKTELTSVKDLLMTNLLNDVNANDDDQNATPPVAPTPPATPPEVVPNKVDDSNVDISKKIEDAITQREANQRRQANANSAEKVMLEQYESKEAAIAAVQARAAQLNVEPQFIANLAFESPSAYFELMGINPDVTPRNTETPAPRSDVNAQRLSELNPRIKENTYRYFAEMRKTDPSRYRSADVQNRMMKEAESNPNFYT